MRRLGRALLTATGELIDLFGSGQTRDDLHQTMAELRTELSQLRLEKVRLEQEVDALRFNGPTLWSDEAIALDTAVTVLGGEGYDISASTLRQLSSRCDRLPMTKKELEESCRKAVEDGDEW